MISIFYKLIIDCNWLIVFSIYLKEKYWQNIYDEICKGDYINVTKKIKCVLKHN